MVCVSIAIKLAFKKELIKNQMQTAEVHGVAKSWTQRAD